MAHLWIEESPSDWAIVPLPSSGVDITATPDGRIVRIRGVNQHAADVAAVRVCSGPDTRRQWHLMAPRASRVSINGLPLLGGMRVLADRDEVHVAGCTSFFFSTEELARVVAMAVTDTVITCPRCRQRIEPGVPAVTCPACGLWHHQSEDLPCWNYAATCALCPQLTAVDVGYQWTPMEL